MRPPTFVLSLLAAAQATVGTAQQPPAVTVIDQGPAFPPAIYSCKMVNEYATVFDFVFRHDGRTVTIIEGHGLIPAGEDLSTTPNARSIASANVRQSEVEFGRGSEKVDLIIAEVLIGARESIRLTMMQPLRDEAAALNGNGGYLTTASVTAQGMCVRSNLQAGAG